MTITTTPSGNELLIAITGRLDTTNYNEVETQANDWLNGNYHRLLLDCTNLDYISSSGLRVFLIIQKRMTNLGGSFYLFGLQPGIREIFDISGFSAIFSLYPDLTAIRNQG